VCLRSIFHKHCTRTRTQGVFRRGQQVAAPLHMMRAAHARVTPMHEQMTVLRPAAHSPRGDGISSAFPPEVLEQVRERVQLLSALLLVAFAFDLVVFAGNWLAIVIGYPPPSGFFQSWPFQVVNGAAVAASGGLWWMARRRRVSATRLHMLGLAYEIVICFVIATITFWQYYALEQRLPNLTWVPVVIVLFPLIMPGPPRRMLAAAIAAGATAPAALLLLDWARSGVADTVCWHVTPRSRSSGRQRQTTPDRWSPRRHDADSNVKHKPPHSSGRRTP
jgi:hypothetical protein